MDCKVQAHTFFLEQSHRLSVGMVNKVLLSKVTRTAKRRGWHLKPVEEVMGSMFDRFFGGIFRTDGQSFVIPSEGTSKQFRGRFLLGSHEWNERKLVQNYMPREAKVLELGGGLGVVSCFVNRRLSNPKNHVVVEPDPRSLAALKQNRIRNKAEFHIAYGVISRHKEAPFFLFPTSCGSSSRPKPRTRKTVVPGLRIDALQKQYSITFDTFIIDIEGAELVLVRQNRQWFKRVNLVIMEVHPDRLSSEKLEKLRELLIGCGLNLTKAVFEVEVWQRR
ncbi:FkbM family methyltransferase [Flexibacterium corallicola]|uniref:FkbM family methyltransferase n=1 Tax=Flexibacterium corallicola TaxID=3037259 RepID=UPI00286F6A50|nr:FkbM family methyltransferase [Pseudovibrio sp. M1P-2-3]